jgi:hypothetical protein
MAMSRCPHCNNPLTMDERQMRNCPACGRPLAGGGGDPVMMEVARPASRGEPYWDKPTPSSYQAPGWGSVRTALTLTALGWLLIQVFVLVFQIIRANPPQGPAPGIAVLFRVLDYAIIVGAVYFLTGLYASCLAPADSLAKVFGIIVSLVVSVGFVVFIILIVGEVSSGQAVRVRIGGGDKSEPWKPETFKTLGYVLVISIFVAMVLFTFFQWAVALKLRRTAMSVCILVFLVLEVAGIVALFVMALKLEGFMNPGAQPSGEYLATPVKMLIIPKEKRWAEWLIVGTSTFLCLWFLVQSLVLRHAAKRAMTRQ